MTDQAVEQSGTDKAPDMSTMEGAEKAYLQRLQKREAEPAKPEAKQEPKAEQAEPVEQKEPEAEQAASEPPKFKVPKFTESGDVDGELEATAEELRAMFLMQQDYTRKTQQTAAEKKKVAEEAAAFAKERTEKAQALESHIQTLARLTLAEEQQTDWEKLKHENPTAYVQMRERQAARLAAIEQAQAEHSKLTEEAVERAIKDNSELLSSLIPEWTDEKAATREKAEMRDYLTKSYGVKPEVLDALGRHEGDAVLVTLARKAMLYDKGKAKAQEVQKKIEAAPPPVKPSAAKQNTDADKIREASRQLRKTGSIQDAERAYLARLQSKTR